MDFVSDWLLHGHSVHFILIDEFSNDSFAVDPAFLYPSISVVRKLEDIAREHGTRTSCASTTIQSSSPARWSNGQPKTVLMLK